MHVKLPGFQAFATFNYCRKSGSTRNRPKLGFGVETPLMKIEVWERSETAGNTKKYHTEYS